MAIKSKKRYASHILTLYSQAHTLEGVNLLHDHSFCLTYSKGSPTTANGQTIRTNSQPHYESDLAHEIQDSFLLMPHLHGIGLFSAAPGTGNSKHLQLSRPFIYLFIYFCIFFFFSSCFRKLTASGRSAVEARSTTTQAEAELEREEEEMLAMTRLLKQVDETEAVLVAKKMILEASGSSEVSNGAGAESSVNGHSEDSVTTQQDDAIVDQPNHGKI